MSVVQTNQNNMGNSRIWNTKVFINSLRVFAIGGTVTPFANGLNTLLDI